MLRMSRLLLVFLLAFSPSAFSEINACKEPYVIQVGPEFSSNFMIDYFGNFTLSLAQSLGCGTRIQGTKNYREFLKSILAHKADIYLVPHHFMPALANEGYIPALERAATTEILYITQISSFSAESFGKDKILQVYTPGRLSMDQFGIEQWLQDQKITNYEQHHSHTYASVMLRSIKQPNIVATVPKNLFERTPNNIQAKLKVYPSGIFVGGYIIVHKNSSKDVINAIHHSKDQLALEQWSDKPEIKPNQYSQRFQENFNLLKKPTK